jgi:hypothetical protein
LSNAFDRRLAGGQAPLRSAGSCAPHGAAGWNGEVAHRAWSSSSSSSSSSGSSSSSRDSSGSGASGSGSSSFGGSSRGADDGGLLAGGLLAELRSWARFLLPGKFKAVYYPTPMPVALKMLQLAGVGPDDVVGAAGVWQSGAGAQLLAWPHTPQLWCGRS